MQIYLGGFDTEDQAALAYDIAAIKCRSHNAITNFDLSNYESEMAYLGTVRELATSCISIRLPYCF